MDFSNGPWGTISQIQHTLCRGVADDRMNRFETALTGGLTIPFGNFEFGPMLRFALIDYSKFDRTDFMSSLSL